MQSFEWLEAEQIRERIFSAGIAGAGASARRVMDTLEGEAAALLRPRGASRCAISAAQIEQAEEKLQAAQAEAERYVTLEQEEEKFAARVAASPPKKPICCGRRSRSKALLERWSDCERARQELAVSRFDRMSFPPSPKPVSPLSPKTRRSRRDAVRRHCRGTVGQGAASPGDSARRPA